MGDAHSRTGSSTELRKRPAVQFAKTAAAVVHAAYSEEVMRIASCHSPTVFETPCAKSGSTATRFKTRSAYHLPRALPQAYRPFQGVSTSPLPRSAFNAAPTGARGGVKDRPAQHSHACFHAELQQLRARCRLIIVRWSHPARQDCAQLRTRRLRALAQARHNVGITTPGCARRHATLASAK